uniref:Uncharacterized protein n=1 Tax=viral metagenome TaxID=1070528 RepID=A0A6M3J8V0_9ZZZZ
MSAADLMKRQKALANKVRQMNDGDLMTLFYEASAWRRFKLEQLGNIEREAGQDIVKAEIEKKALEAETKPKTRQKKTGPEPKMEQPRQAEA